MMMVMAAVKRFTVQSSWLIIVAAINRLIERISSIWVVSVVLSHSSLLGDYVKCFSTMNDSRSVIWQDLLISILKASLKMT